MLGLFYTHYLELNGSPTLLKVSERIAVKSWRIDRKNFFYSSKNFFAL